MTQSTDARIRAQIEVHRAVALRQLGALRAARSAAERATQLSSDYSDLRTEAYTVLASLLAREGLFDLARDTVDTAIRFAQENSSKRLLGQAWSQRGTILGRQGDYKAARTAFLESRKLFIHSGDERSLTSVEGNIALCLTELGSLTLARQRFMKAVELARQQSDPARESLWLVGLTRLSMLEGDLDQADKYASEAARIAQLIQFDLAVFGAEWFRHLAVRQRDPDRQDGARLGKLRKLYARLHDHHGEWVVRDYEAAGFPDKGES